MTNKRNGTLYIGITSSILHRTWQHRTGAIPGFTKKYGLGRLVYFEFLASFAEATHREKQLKKWRRSWKVGLIESKNPRWKDLFPLLIE